jgi:hypothetical protein
VSMFMGTDLEGFRVPSSVFRVLVLKTEDFPFFS